MMEKKIMKFNCYGTRIEGEFVAYSNNRYKVKITEDFISENIGKIQSIHEDHLLRRRTLTDWRSEEW